MLYLVFWSGPLAALIANVPRGWAQSARVSACPETENREAIGLLSRGSRRGGRLGDSVVEDL